jgi:DNA polymerase family A
MRYILDIESNSLLQTALDYSTMPYRLKDTSRLWCIVLRNIDTGQIHKLIKTECSSTNLKNLLMDATEIIGHNIIGFDLPYLMLSIGLDYSIGYPNEPSFIFGKEVKITDTLLWSKLLHADRLGGHSLAAWGKRLGNYKDDFHQWDEYSQEMLDYCIQDTAVNESIFNAITKEKGKHNWDSAYSMESKLQDLTLKQELVGFSFNTELASRNIQELSTFMQETQAKVNPILPVKQMTKSELGIYTLPKIRFKKDGTPSSNLLKFVEKHKCVLDVNTDELTYEGKIFKLKDTLYLKNSKAATVEDIDVVKAYLLNLGWEPSEVKERDLSKNTDKTIKTVPEMYEAIDRYVKQTETSLFRALRLEHLNCTMEGLKNVLLSKLKEGRALYVPTNPKLAVGLEKELCPNLVKLGNKAEFVQSVVQYYTYRHRKNSIAGGLSTDTEQDDEPLTGFLSALREDGRIPTPADTLGANTGRYRHKVVCNIPRVTSLYGEQMRNMFGCGKGLYQLGYDFASLEARIMAHYILPYENGQELATALLAVKPNDIHSINARKLGIRRDEAKSFAYASIYGAQPKKLAKMLNISEGEAKQLFNAYWEAVLPLKQLKERLEKVWEQSGKRSILGLDGRLLSTRSKHSLINVLFQSGGAISAKWSAVFLAQALENNSLLGNPFTDTMQDKKVWWLIHMHDEQQMGVHPSLLDIRVYKTDDEAKAVREDGCSAIGHGSKGPYVAFKTQPIVCIDEAIKKATQHLNLRVELGFEYNTGLSWGQCH